MHKAKCILLNSDFSSLPPSEWNIEQEIRLTIPAGLSIGDEVRLDGVTYEVVRVVYDLNLQQYELHVANI